MIIEREELKYLNNMLTYEALKNCNYIEINYSKDAKRIKNIERYKFSDDYLRNKKIIVRKIRNNYILLVDNESYSLTEDEFNNFRCPYELNQDIESIVEEINKKGEWQYSGNKSQFEKNYKIKIEDLLYQIGVENLTNGKIIYYSSTPNGYLCLCEDDALPF